MLDGVSIRVGTRVTNLIGGVFVGTRTLVSVGCAVFTGMLVGSLGLVGLGFGSGILSPMVVAVECAIGSRV